MSGRGERSIEVSCVFEFVKWLQPQALHNHATCTGTYSASGGSSMYALPLYYSIPPPSSIINLPPPPPPPTPTHTHTTDNIPALCCAPNLQVAECLECILQAMLGQKGIAL